MIEFIVNVIEDLVYEYFLCKVFFMFYLFVGLIEVSTVFLKVKYWDGGIIRWKEFEIRFVGGLSVN